MAHEVHSQCKDNDPVDLFDIGQDPGYAGQIKQVKILGCLALNDGMCLWQILPGN
jgi:inorganic pyrophosphatase